MLLAKLSELELLEIFENWKVKGHCGLGIYGNY